MAYNSRQKSASSGSARRSSACGGAGSRSGGDASGRLADASRSTGSTSARSSRSAASRSTRTSRASAPTRVASQSARTKTQTQSRSRTSTSARSASRPTQVRTIGTVADLQKQARAQARAESMARAVRATRRPFIIIGVIAALVVAVLVTLFVLSRTNAFEVENIQFTGAEHLTQDEVAALVSLPVGTTLLNVDAQSIESSLLRDSWVQSVDVNRIFPSTLEIVVTERKIAAVVEVPVGSQQTIQNWAIADDGVWLMAIPNQDSEIGQQISQSIYDDADAAIHITGVQAGVTPEIGAQCTDENVNNALEIITGLTTELADQIKTVSAADADSTVITLTSNVEIAFGTADNIRDKERVCLALMEEYPTIVYINVRVVDRPTWKAA